MGRSHIKWSGIKKKKRKEKKDGKKSEKKDGKGQRIKKARKKMI